jgi:hypothetical protein
MFNLEMRRAFPTSKKQRKAIPVKKISTNMNLLRIGKHTNVILIKFNYVSIHLYMGLENLKKKNCPRFNFFYITV